MSFMESPVSSGEKPLLRYLKRRRETFVKEKTCKPWMGPDSTERGPEERSAWTTGQGPGGRVPVSPRMDRVPEPGLPYLLPRPSWRVDRRVKASAGALLVDTLPTPAPTGTTSAPDSRSPTPPPRRPTRSAAANSARASAPVPLARTSHACSSSAQAPPPPVSDSSPERRRPPCPDPPSKTVYGPPDPTRGLPALRACPAHPTATAATGARSPGPDRRGGRNSQRAQRLGRAAARYDRTGTGGGAK